MVQVLHEGGPTMLVILALALPALAFAILHVVLARPWTLITTLALMAVILAIGLYGRADARSRVDRALADINEPDQELIRAQGYKESSRPLQLAAVVDGLLAVGVIVGEIRRRHKRR